MTVLFPSIKSVAVEAVELDKAGSMGDAMNTYLKAVDLLFDVHEGKTRTESSRDIVEMISIYLARVDEILKNAPASRPSPPSIMIPSSSTPTTGTSTRSPTVLSASLLSSSVIKSSPSKPFASPLVSPLLTTITPPRNSPRSLKFVQFHEVDPLAVAMQPLYALGQPEILWVSPVQKKGRSMKRLLGRSRIEKRCTALTATAIFTGKDKRLMRCAPLAEISEIVISKEGWVGVRVPTQYDFLFIPTNGDVPQKVEALAALLEDLVSAYNYTYKVIHCDTLQQVPDLRMKRPAGWVPPPFLKIPISKVASTPSSGRRNAVAVCANVEYTKQDDGNDDDADDDCLL
eukprot:TRINITY_DN3481_c0_g2_i1.p1 TRINITY_DN3481_c0_g2~~TRINITY_DN3481_c0_g2_i1.p1  ORF type:complete len:344 (+),score=69.04 TRINITY_DN3481_c0_g2_i1:80-1111(+)